MDKVLITNNSASGYYTGAMTEKLEEYTVEHFSYKKVFLKTFLHKTFLYGVLFYLFYSNAFK